MHQAVLQQYHFHYRGPTAMLAYSNWGFPLNALLMLWIEVRVLHARLMSFTP